VRKDTSGRFRARYNDERALITAMRLADSLKQMVRNDDSPSFSLCALFHVFEIRSQLQISLNDKLLKRASK
jgi:hypothetical protein